MVGLLFYVGWSGTCLQWTFEGNEEVRSRSCGYLEGAHLRLRESQCGGPEGSRLLTQSRRLVLLDQVSDGLVGG